MKLPDFDISSFNGINEEFLLSDKVVLITGGIGGIGTSISHLFLKKGALVGSVYPPFEEVRASKIQREYEKERISFHVCDITKEDEVVCMIEEVYQKYGRIDVLINSAGYVQIEKVPEISLIEWQKQIAVCLTGPFLVCKTAVEYMKRNRRGGKVINIASQAAHVALEGHGAYAAAKAGLVGFSKVMAKELAPYKINVNTISPTVVLTPMGKRVWDGSKGDKMRQLIPLGRFAFPQEIAAAALFLASDGADMVTGTDLRIDGGYTVY